MILSFSGKQGEMHRRTNYQAYIYVTIAELTLNIPVIDHFDSCRNHCVIFRSRLQS